MRRTVFSDLQNDSLELQPYHAVPPPPPPTVQSWRSLVVGDDEESSGSSSSSSEDNEHAAQPLLGGEGVKRPAGGQAMPTLTPERAAKFRDHPEAWLLFCLSHVDCTAPPPWMMPRDEDARHGTAVHVTSLEEAEALLEPIRRGDTSPSFEPYTLLRRVQRALLGDDVISGRDDTKPCYAHRELYLIATDLPRCVNDGRPNVHQLAELSIVGVDKPEPAVYAVLVLVDVQDPEAQPPPPPPPPSTTTTTSSQSQQRKQQSAAAAADDDHNAPRNGSARKRAAQQHEAPDAPAAKRARSSPAQAEPSSLPLDVGLSDRIDTKPWIKVGGLAVLKAPMLAALVGYAEKMITERLNAAVYMDDAVRDRVSVVTDRGSYAHNWIVQHQGFDTEPRYYLWELIRDFFARAKGDANQCNLLFRNDTAQHYVYALWLLSFFVYTEGDITRRDVVRNYSSALERFVVYGTDDAMDLVDERDDKEDDEDAGPLLFGMFSNLDGGCSDGSSERRAKPRNAAKTRAVFIPREPDLVSSVKIKPHEVAEVILKPAVVGRGKFEKRRAEALQYKWTEGEKEIQLGSLLYDRHTTPTLDRWHTVVHRMVAHLRERNNKDLDPKAFWVLLLHVAYACFGADQAPPVAEFNAMSWLPINHY